MNIRFLILCTLALPVLASAEAGEVYKWRDSNGVVRYSDTPPPSNVKHEVYGKKSKVVSGQAPLAEVEGDATAAMNKQKAATDKALAEKAKADKAPLSKEEAAAKRAKEAEELKKIEAQKKAELEVKAENCKVAKSNLATYTNGGRITRTNEKGEREYYTDAEIAKGRVESQAEVEKHCN